MDVKTKLKVVRTLKTISYLIGFPLFALLVLVDSMDFLAGEIYEQTALNGLKIACAIWAVVAFVQIGLKLIVKRREPRVLITVVLTLIIMLVPAIIIDSVWSNKLDTMQAEEDALGHGVTVKTYGKQAGWYIARTPDKKGYAVQLTENVEDFLRVYNITYEGNNKDINVIDQPIVTDEGSVLYYNDNAGKASVYTLDAEGNKVDYTANITSENGNLFYKGEQIYGKYGKARYYKYSISEDYEDGYYGLGYYNKGNGMLADSYVFSLENAINILIDYYSAEVTFNNTLVNSKGAVYGKATFEEEYAAALKAAYNSDEWKAYVASDAYKAEIAATEAYALVYTDTKGNLKLRTDRLNEILGVLGSNLAEDNVLSNVLDLLFGIAPILGLGDIESALISGLVNAEIIDISGYATAEEITQIKAGTIPSSFNDNDKTQAVQSFIDYIADGDLNVAAVEALLKSFGLEPSALADLVSGLGLEITVAADASLEDVLAALLNQFYWYDNPAVLPIYDFFEENAAYLAAYGRAEYEASRHGSFVGSDLLNPEETAFTLEEIYQLQNDLSYKTELYPLLALRHDLYTCAGIIVFAIILSSTFARKEEELDEVLAKSYKEAA